MLLCSKTKLQLTNYESAILLKIASYHLKCTFLNFENPTLVAKLKLPPMIIKSRNNALSVLKNKA